MNSSFEKFLHIIGVVPGYISHHERIISTVGGFFGIFGIIIVSVYAVGEQGAAMIVASMGASAVLLFAVPHGALAQPWNLFCGHLVSAVVGVTCARYIPDTYVAAAASVGLAIGAMHYLRCIHPPGGATALTAVLGGPSVIALGYGYVLMPVLINVLVILIIAVMFNAFFKWRRYPSAFAPCYTSKQLADDIYPPIQHADLVYALSQLDTIVAASEEDLLNIYALATGDKNAEKDKT